MENKVVIVTGSTRGIGKATIIKFASKGYNVVINYVSSEKEANELKGFVEDKYGIKALAIKCDVSNEEQVKQLVSIVIREFGKIDVEIYECRGLCSFYAEKGGVLVGFERI